MGLVPAVLVAEAALAVVTERLDRAGRRISDQMLLPAVRVGTSGREMLIETVNGSIWQMTGSDNFDSLVGSNPVGVIFSEWALSDPDAWEYLRPILVENEGWAIFITPRTAATTAMRLLVAARAATEGTVMPWFAGRKKELANRPLIRERAFGEALDPDKLERLGRYEVHLDRKLERMLAMLLRLKDLRAGAVPG